MKHTVSTLEGPLLDAAVAKAEGHVLRRSNGYWAAKGSRAVPWFAVPEYSTSWAYGGQIIERERISVGPGMSVLWFASIGGRGDDFDGSTPLIAAMRAYVASKFGFEVELLENTDGLQAPGA